MILFSNWVFLEKTAANLHDFLKPPTAFFKKITDENSNIIRIYAPLIFKIK